MRGTILLLDDDDSILKMLSAMLKILEFDTKITKNAEDLIAEFKTSISNNAPISAMILDLSLPDGRGGKEIIGELRQIDDKIPIFVASGHSGDDIVVNPKRYGFSGAIMKPFSIAELGNVLNLSIK